MAPNARFNKLTPRHGDFLRFFRPSGAGNRRWVRDAPLEQVIVEAKPPRFRIGNSEVSFPVGQIHVPLKRVSDRGFWIVAPAGTMPQLKSH